MRAAKTGQLNGMSGATLDWGKRSDLNLWWVAGGLGIVVLVATISRWLMLMTYAQAPEQQAVQEMARDTALAVSCAGVAALMTVSLHREMRKEFGRLRAALLDVEERWREEVDEAADNEADEDEESVDPRIVGSSHTWNTVMPGINKVLDQHPAYVTATLVAFLGPVCAFASDVMFQAAHWAIERLSQLFAGAVVLV
jgi:hypothetical protein